MSSSSSSAPELSEGLDDDAGSESPSWISWFCTLRGNEFFVEVRVPSSTPEKNTITVILHSQVDVDYIEDDFNLSGLSSQVPYYDYALDMILDNDPPHDVMLTDQASNPSDVLYIQML